MKCKPLKVIPCKTLESLILYFWIFAFLVLGIVFSIIVYNNKDFGATIPGIICTVIVIMLGVVIYALIRIFHTTYYIVDKAGIRHISRKGKKVLFEIRKEDIAMLGYRKLPWYKKLDMVVGMFESSDPKCDLLSIRYLKADIDGRRCVMGSNTILSTLPLIEQAKGYKEYCDCITKSQIKRIGEILQIPVTEGIEVTEVIRLTPKKN